MLVSLPKASSTLTEGAFGDRTGFATAGKVWGRRVDVRLVGVISADDSASCKAAREGLANPLGVPAVVLASEFRDDCVPDWTLIPFSGFNSGGPTTGTATIESEDKSPGSTSNLTFRMLFFRKEPPGVGAHAPGGAGVCIGMELDRERDEGPGVANAGLEGGGVRSGGVELGRGGGSLAAGGGVTIQAPGGLGVFMAVKFPRKSLSWLGLTGVLSLSMSGSVSSSDGGPGRSGKFLGGEGVKNSSFDV